SFLKDREWAVRLCRAYNTMMHEEFIKQSPRLQSVALLPVQDPKAAAVELRRAVSELGHVGGMLDADGTHLLGDERFLPVYEYAKRAEEAPALRKKPSEYIRSGSIFFSCEADEWLLPQAVKLVGENQIVYASDFPHWDHSFPGSIDEIKERVDITDAQKRKILADNTRRLYGLKP